MPCSEPRRVGVRCERGLADGCNRPFPLVGTIGRFDDVKAMCTSVFLQLDQAFLVFGARRDIAVGIEHRDVVPLLGK